MTEYAPRSEGDMTAAVEFVASKLQDAAPTFIDRSCEQVDHKAQTWSAEEHARAHDWAPWAETGPLNKRNLKQSILDVVLATLAYEDTKPFQPKRDDAVATWLKRHRDAQEDAPAITYLLLDNMLDEYRLRADTGVTLDKDLDE